MPRLKKIRLVIFDLDGTLVNACPAITRSFKQAMRVMEYPPQNDLVICRAVGWGDRNLLKPFVKRDDLDAALLVYRRHHQKALLRWSRLLPGVRQMLKKLKAQGYLLAIASNRPSRFARIILSHLKIEKYFQCVVCGDELRHIKPHPAILLKIMKRLKSVPQETVYVGDMSIDAQAGQRAKVKTIIVTTGLSTRGEIKKAKPTLIIGRIADLAQLL